MYLSGCREEKDRVDWLCCILARKPEGKLVGKGQFVRTQPELMTKCLNAYARKLLTPAGKVIAMALGAMLLGLGIWQCTRIEVDFEYEWFVPDGSYYKQHIEIYSRYWGNRLTPVSIYSFDGDYSAEVGSLVTSLTIALCGCTTFTSRIVIVFTSMGGCVFIHRRPHRQSSHA
jgi:hypothetical protein